MHASHLKQLQHAEAHRQMITRSLLFDKGLVYVSSYNSGGGIPLSFGIIGIRELERKMLLNNIFCSVRYTIPPILQVLQGYANPFGMSLIKLPALRFAEPNARAPSRKKNILTDTLST